jgi:hypothetical protein
MLTVDVVGGSNDSSSNYVNLALDETLDGAQLSLYTFENALLRHIGTHASICINASNRAHVVLTVNRSLESPAPSLLLCVSSGARIDCVLPPVAYAPTMRLACAYVLVRCEGFDSVVDLNNAFDVQRAIVLQSGKSSQIRNFNVLESIYTRIEEPDNIVNVSIDPTRGCRHELLSSKFAQYQQQQQQGSAARIVVSTDIKHRHSAGMSVLCK